MTLVFMDGFDCYASGADNDASGGMVLNNTAQFSTSEGRYGGGCLRNNGTFGNVNQLNFTGAQGETFIACFAYFHPGSAATTDAFRFRTTGGAALAGISHDVDGKISFNPQSGSSITETGTSLTPNQWVWVEFSVTFGTNASTGSFEVRVNGTTVLSGGSLDTHTGVNPGQFCMMGAGGSVNTRRMDDLVLIKVDGTAPNTFIGDSRIDNLRPNGNTADADWSGGTNSSDYLEVDDTLNAADGDTTYISVDAAATGDVSRFAYTNLVGTPNSIRAVQPRIRARKTDAGAAAYRAFIDSGAVANGPTINPTEGYVWHRNGMFVQDPNTTAAWIATGVNALTVGVEVM
jgi:hypothetical protein